MSRYGCTSLLYSAARPIARALEGPDLLVGVAVVGVAGFEPTTSSSRRSRPGSHVWHATSGRSRSLACAGSPASPESPVIHRVSERRVFNSVCRQLSLASGYSCSSNYSVSPGAARCST